MKLGVRILHTGIPPLAEGSAQPSVFNLARNARLLGYSPVVPSHYGNRYAYGHIVEESRNLIVSGGLGCSGVPLRFGSPPELVMIELGA